MRLGALLLLLGLARADTLRPPLKVKDEGVTKGYVHTLNFTGAGVTCTVANGAAACDVTGGGGGSPGGSGAELQYRSGASTFGAVSKVTSDGTHLTYTDVTAPPSAPAAGVTTFFHSPVTTTAPAFPGFVDANGINFGVFPFIGAGHGYWGCIHPAGFTNATTVSGVAFAGSSVGTWASGSLATTSLLGRSPRFTATTSSTAGSSAEVRGTAGYMYRGANAGEGGFFWYASVAVTATSTGMRSLFGLTGNASALANGAANANTHSAYFGCEEGETNFSFCTNDGTSTATCTALGASYPCATVGAHYNLYIWAGPNASVVNYAIERFDSAASTSGNRNSDLPANNVPLMMHAWINNGSSTGQPAFAFLGMCYLGAP